MAFTDTGVSYPHVKELLHPTETEVEQAVNVLVDAFEGDSFSAILLEGDLDLAHQELHANVKAALIGGQVHVITVDLQAIDIVGIAIWYPPGSSAFSSEEQRVAGWDEFLATAPDSLRKWWIDYVGREKASTR